MIDIARSCKVPIEVTANAELVMRPNRGYERSSTQLKDLVHRAVTDLEKLYLIPR